MSIPVLFAKLIRSFSDCRRGSVAIQIGLMLPVLIGMTALGTEITFAIFKHRQMQSAADSAALGAATALATGHPADPADEARAIAASAKFIDSVAGVKVQVNIPPMSGSFIADERAVEVVVSQPQTLSMVGLFRNGPVMISAHAVAITSTGKHCMLALDSSAAGAIAIRNNAIVTNPLCGVAANSSSTEALTLSNNAQVNGPVSVHGDWSLANNAQLNGTPLINNGPLMEDPYANVQLQTAPSCTGQSGSANKKGTINLTPGHFCTGWDYSNNVTLNLAAGAYYIDQKMVMANNTVLNATSGVTIVINGNYAINVGNNSAINITAPSTGPYAGLALMGLRNATSTLAQLFSNNTTMNIKGAVYFPNQIVEFDNNGSTSSGGCTQVIGRMIRVRNNVRLDNNCDGTGVKSIGSSRSQLVE